MEQSLSCEANGPQLVRKSPLSFMEPEGSYKSPPSIPVLSPIDPVHAPIPPLEDPF